jgi:hypothetical protein
VRRGFNHIDDKQQQMFKITESVKTLREDFQGLEKDTEDAICKFKIKLCV